MSSEILESHDSSNFGCSCGRTPSCTGRDATIYDYAMDLFEKVREEYDNEQMDRETFQLFMDMETEWCDFHDDGETKKAEKVYCEARRLWAKYTEISY